MPLQRGFVGVVCRSQQDIVDGKMPDAAREAERRFLEARPAPCYIPLPCYARAAPPYHATLHLLSMRHPLTSAHPLPRHTPDLGTPLTSAHP